MGFQKNGENGLCVSFLPLNFPFRLMGVLWIFLEALGGLGKGDPLSPFLFDVVLEALSCMLDVAIAAGQFSSFSVGSTPSTSMMVSRLLFVNDTLIFL